MTKALSVIFICSQNTCRSIAAEAVFSYLIKETKMPFNVASAGTDARPNRSPEANIHQVAASRGYQLGAYYSKSIQDQDLAVFDYLLAMDQSTVRQLHSQVSREDAQKIQLLTRYACFFNKNEDGILYPASQEVREFVYMLDCIEDACLGLWNHLCHISALPAS